MTDKTYRTTSGKTLTDADIDALADDVATADYDTEPLQGRRRGRPLLGSAPAEVVPVRLDPELRAAIEARADADDTVVDAIGHPGTEIADLAACAYEPPWIQGRLKKRAGDAGRAERLQAVESGEDELAQRVITDGEHAGRASRADQMKRLADGVRARSAGIGNDADGTIGL